MNNTTLISTNQVFYSYPFTKQVILQNVSITITSNSFIGIIGANGAGKTTLLQLLIGLKKPTSGNITFTMAKKNIAYVAQHNSYDALFPISVGDIIMMGLISPWRIPQVKKHTNAIQKYLTLVELPDMPLHTQFAKLSGGQKQRVLFARALACNAQLLVLDEPFANIDIKTEQLLLQLLTDLHAHQHCSIIMVNHNIAQIIDICNSIICVTHPHINEQINMQHSSVHHHHNMTDINNELIHEMFGIIHE